MGVSFIMILDADSNPSLFYSLLEGERGVVLVHVCMGHFGSDEQKREAICFLTMPLFFSCYLLASQS